tara:strand:- start:272 stop:2443 length:2172 start_codon:yes stop_codon:yes gene_type:complete
VFGNFTISQVNLDSLFGVWKDESKSDTIRLSAINKIAWDGYLFSNPDSAYYFAQLEYDFAVKVDNKKHIGIALNLQGVSFQIRGNHKKALEYYKKTLLIFEQIGFKSGVQSSYINIGLVYDNQGNYYKAIDYYEKSLRIAKEIDYKTGIGLCYNNIGNIYLNRGNNEKALEYYEMALKIGKKLGDKKRIRSSYNNIGLIYENLGNYDRAMYFYEKSLKINEELADKLRISYSYNNIGNIYLDQEYYDKAMDYYEKSLRKAEELGDKSNIGMCYNNIGTVYQYKGNFNKALEYFQKGLTMRLEINDKSEIGESYFNIGNIYKEQNNLDKELNYLLKAKKIFKEINVIYNLDVVAKSLMEVYEKLGKPQKALENYKLYVNIKDSLAKMDAEKQLYKFEIDKNYELEKQADSIKHADEIILHQAEAITQKQRSNGLVLISIIILISLCLVFNQLKKVKKGKLLVEERNIVIEEKQKEITESIKYAKRLQDGILVPLDLVQSWLSESFILFKPKDIVSGDFYWIEKVGDKIYFAVADCTGHGIPGALVSIICSNALSKSLQEDKISSPAKILDATRKLVEERFVRAADSIKDGMDISLCCLNVKTKTITWSGAMNPLWVVKKDAKEIQELKPDRQAIGMVENPKSFTEYKFKIAVGDSVYLFSDGYLDQFGGPKGKKYMKGKMKKFVLSLQNQSMQEQLVSFDKEFNSWKGNRDQIDDVCVMGVRIT